MLTSYSAEVWISVHGRICHRFVAMFVKLPPHNISLCVSLTHTHTHPTHHTHTTHSGIYCLMSACFLCLLVESAPPPSCIKTWVTESNGNTELVEQPDPDFKPGSDHQSQHVSAARKRPAEEEEVIQVLESDILSGEQPSKRRRVTASPPKKSKYVDSDSEGKHVHSATVALYTVKFWCRYPESFMFYVLKLWVKWTIAWEEGGPKSIKKARRPILLSNIGSLPVIAVRVWQSAGHNMFLIV